LYRIGREREISMADLYYNMKYMASSASSSSVKSYPVLIKKAMAKMPMSNNTKKSIDEYYKNAMMDVHYKMKAVEKAKKEVEKAKKAAEKARLAAEKAAAKVAKPKAVKAKKAKKAKKQT
jgi:glycine cleavage system protein P-like pyridoxal-binding family